MGKAFHRVLSLPFIPSTLFSPIFRIFSRDPTRSQKVRRLPKKARTTPNTTRRDAAAREFPFRELSFFRRRSKSAGDATPCLKVRKPRRAVHKQGALVSCSWFFHRAWLIPLYLFTSMSQFMLLCVACDSFLLVVVFLGDVVLFLMVV